MADGAHGERHYKKIWVILCVLLVVSVVGPLLAGPLEHSLEAKGVTFFKAYMLVLPTAFGIAFVKAYIVVKNFMHLNVEQPFIRYILATMLVFMVLFFAGTSGDVMKHEGRQWENVAAKKEIKRAQDAAAAQGDPHHQEH